MSTLITLLIVIAAIALILIVLVQKSKGGGLSSGFSSSNSIMGVRKTTDFLEKATWGLMGFIMVMCITAVVIAPKRHLIPQSEIEVPAPQQNELPNMSPGSSAIPTTPVPSSNIPTPAPQNEGTGEN